MALRGDFFIKKILPTTFWNWIIMVGFVGLIVPHLVRLLCGPDNRYLLPHSIIFGALFMALADLLSRVLISPAQLPVGILTALVGGPFFLLLLTRGRAFGGGRA